MKTRREMEYRPRRTRHERLPRLEELAWLASPAGRSAWAAMAAGEPADMPAFS